MTVERAKVVVSDPKAIKNAKLELSDLRDQIEFEEDPYAAAEGAHAIALLTEWKQFKELSELVMEVMQELDT